MNFSKRNCFLLSTSHQHLNNKEISFTHSSSYTADKQIHVQSIHCGTATSTTSPPLAAPDRHPGRRWSGYVSVQVARHQLPHTSHWGRRPLRVPPLGLGRPLSPSAPSLEGPSEGLPAIRPRGPEVVHYRPRALWMSGVVNHCQLHISVCLGAPHLRPFSSHSRWEMTSKCWQISRFTATRRWLIIQSHCITARAQKEGGGALYLADIKQQSGGPGGELCWSHSAGTENRCSISGRLALFFVLFFFLFFSYCIDETKRRPGLFGLSWLFSITVADLQPWEILYVHHVNHQPSVHYYMAVGSTVCSCHMSQ